MRPHARPEGAFPLIEGVVDKPWDQSHGGIVEMKKDSNNASFVYSVNLLRMLLGMELITKEEYNKIVAISEDHYGTKIFFV